MVILNWLALLLTPSLALTTLAINYASVTQACEQQGGSELHIVAAVSLTLSLILTLRAWRNARLASNHGLTPDEPPRSRPYFVAKVAALVGLLSSLVIIAQWLPIWVLSPCIA